MTLFILLITPIIATLISVLAKKQHLVEIVGVAAAVIQVVAGLVLLTNVAYQGSYRLNEFFALDALSALLVAIIPIIGFISICYSVGYFRKEVSKEIIGFRRVRECYVLIHIFLLMMYLAISTTSPVFMWIAIEATTLSTVFLISLYNRASTLEAAWKFLIINSIGLLLAFLGTVTYLAATHTTLNTNFIDWTSLMSVSASLNPEIIKVAFIFILIGYGTKMGLAPMHTWKPDTYSKAATPIVALLSGALMNVAFMAILRFKLITDASVGASFSQNLFLFFGAASIAVAAFSIFNQQNYKRLLAYSSIEHAGVIVLGFGFGGLGIYASLLHMLYHSLTKTLLFLLSGNLLLKYGSTKIKDVLSASTVLPMTSAAFVIGFLAITAMPPFGLFLTVFYILSTGINTHPVLTVTVLGLLAFIFLGFLKQVTVMVFSVSNSNGVGSSKAIPVGEANNWTIFAPLAALVILIVLGFYLPEPLQIILNDAAKIFLK